MPKPPQDIYARHLLSRRGYPLWMPEPSHQLLVYRRDGLRIGDVGVVIPEDGCFDVFFNICLPQDHPFHNATGVPDNFKHIELNDMDIRTATSAENPGRIIANSSVKTMRTVEQSEGTSRSGSPGLEYEFNLSSSEGALLILPEGAERHDLRSHHSFLEAATQHGADWYRFVEEKVGQIIGNDSLYLITGLYKTRSWSLAAFEKTSEGGEHPARFRIAQAWEDNIAAAGRWDTMRTLEWRVGPTDNYGIPNQSVFIRGFKIAYRTGMFRTKWISVKADAPCARPNPVKSSGALPGVSRLRYIFSGLSTGRTTESSKGGRQEHDEIETNPALDAARNEIQNNGALAVGEDVVIQRIPEASQAFHPSDIINRYLLNKDPHANIAITHDDEWIALLEENLLQPENFEQDGLLETLVSQKYQIISNSVAGAVYLRSSNSDPDTHVDEVSAMMVDYESPAITLVDTIPAKEDVMVPQVPQDIWTKENKTIGPSSLGLLNSMDRGIPKPEPYQTRNVLVVGETGVGKSSVINLIAGEQLADIASSASSCSMESTSYDVLLTDNQLLHRHIRLFDTAGLAEPSLSKTSYLIAIENANVLITQLQRTGGIYLLLFCLRGGRITAVTRNNYRLFSEILCQNQVPVALVITGMESEDPMEAWWDRNAAMFERAGLSCSSHVCVTATRGLNGIYDGQYKESQTKIRNMLLDDMSRPSWKPESTRSFIRLAGMLLRQVVKTKGRKQRFTGRMKTLSVEELVQGLQEKCHFSHNEAVYLAGKIWAERTGPDLMVKMDDSKGSDSAI